MKVSGWLSAAHFGDPAQEAEFVRTNVGLCDLSMVSKWGVEGTALASHLAETLGSRVPEPGQAVLYEDGVICRLAQDEALFLFVSESFSLIAALRDRIGSNGCLHMLDRTSGFACFLLSGPQDVSVLRKLTPLDLRDRIFPNLSCAWGPMAGVQVLLLRRDFGALSGFLILVNREYGEYLWDAVTDAGREFQIRPFGWQAVRLLGGPDARTAPF